MVMWEVRQLYGSVTVTGRCERYKKCLLVLWRGVMVMWEV